MEIPEHLNSDEFKEIWSEWVDHRSEIRHKLTPTSAKRQMKFLEKHTETDAIKIIDRSIMQGWQGLFDLPKDMESSEAPKFNTVNPNTL